MCCDHELRWVVIRVIFITISYIFQGSLSSGATQYIILTGAKEWISDFQNQSFQTINMFKYSIFKVVCVLQIF